MSQGKTGRSSGVNLLIAVFKENRLSPIATLHHVVRETDATKSLVVKV